jgi:hypothetical protein
MDAAPTTTPLPAGNPALSSVLSLPRLQHLLKFSPAAAKARAEDPRRYALVMHPATVRRLTETAPDGARPDEELGFDFSSDEALPRDYIELRLRDAARTVVDRFGFTPR